MKENKCTDPIRFLVVDDNYELCDILHSYFDLIDDIELCGTAHNGEDALRKIAHLKPDVVFLDIIMPQLDGISVLEKLRMTPPQYPPKVIIASAIGEDVITSRALTLGANYYMIKPVQLPELENRIRLIGHTRQPKLQREAAIQTELGVRTNTKLQESVIAPELLAAIAQYLMNLHMPTHILGYQYCVRAIAILAQENRRCPLAKHVYRCIAEENQTSIPCVESAIRKAINCTDLPGDQQTSNGTFLTVIAEKIKLELHCPNSTFDTSM